MRHAIVFLCILGSVGCSSPAEPPAKTPPPKITPTPVPPAGPIAVRIVAFNDFHGNLKTPTGGVAKVEGPVGGATYFAAHVKKLTAGRPNTLIVAAGDLVGASPLTSGLFHDEPTVEVMNAVGLSATSVGNHEFDEGIDEILRLQKGGCHPVDGCKWQPSFGGAKYAILGANVTSTATHAAVLPPYVIRTVGGVPIGIIGMTLRDTPHSVLASGVAGLAFADEATTANALVPEIRAKGAETIIVLIHEGGEVRSRGLDECADLTGAIVSIAEKLDPAIDVVVSGHTHALYNCRVAGKTVTSALSYGRVLTTIDLEIDPKTHDVLKSEAHNHAVTHDIAPDAAVQAIVDRAEAAAAPVENRVIGHISETLRASGHHGAAEESGPLGDIIADAQLEATRSKGARVAVINSSGVRADILFPKSGTEADDGIVTYGEAFAAQPFGNPLVTLTTTAADLAEVLGRAIRGHSHLQVSHGLVVYFAADEKPGVSLELDGKKLAPTATVRLTTNDFVADREFGKIGTDRVAGGAELDALEAYFKAHKLVAPPKEHRIVHKPVAGH